jgi:predicted dehydrogenase
MTNSFFRGQALIQKIFNPILSIPAMWASSTSLSEPVAAAKEIPKMVLKHSDHQRILGVALVGLGKYSEKQLAPALLETTKCKLKGIVTGTPEKAKAWKKKYNIPDKNIYNYQNFDLIKNNPDIDIVYIVLPNSMHPEFTIRAAEAGKHVICEKPMAVTAEDCERMIEACRNAGKQLSIGYRLHFDPYNQAMAEYGRQKTFGNINKIVAENGLDIEPGVWRLNKGLAGGGPLMDLGIYCVQGAIYTVDDIPVSVTAQEGEKTDTKRFSEVEQSLTWQMQFANGSIAECKTSYAEEFDSLRAEASSGWFELKPAYEYKGLKGETSTGKLKFPKVNSTPDG